MFLTQRRPTLTLRFTFSSLTTVQRHCISKQLYDRSAPLCVFVTIHGYRALAVRALGYHFPSCDALFVLRSLILRATRCIEQGRYLNPLVIGRGNDGASSLAEGHPCQCCMRAVGIPGRRERDDQNLGPEISEQPVSLRYHSSPSDGRHYGAAWCRGRG